jgi:hypothetical protein
MCGGLHGGSEVEIKADDAQAMRNPSSVRGRCRLTWMLRSGLSAE